MRIVAAYSIKGGVGKTAAAVNLAHIAASRGWRTLLWDLDPQGAATFYLRVRDRIKGGAKGLLGKPAAKSDLAVHLRGTDYPGLDLFPADFSYRNLDRLLAAAADGKQRRRVLASLTRRLRDHYDVLVLDCPPSISSMSENVFNASDALLVPVIPTALSLNTYAQLADFLDRPRYAALLRWPFFSMVDRRRRMHTQTMCDWRPPGGGRVLGAIPLASVVEQMGERREPLGAFASRSAAFAAFTDLWEGVEKALLTPSRTVMKPSLDQ